MSTQGDKMEKVFALIADLKGLSNRMFQKDFLLTWDRSLDELEAVLDVAEVLKELRGLGRTCRVFDSGLAVSIFRDHSTRTRFSFASAANLLGLGVQELDEEKSQVAHGETIRETATMISFLSDVVGIRDDMFLGAGHSYMKEFGEALQSAYDDQVLPRRTTVVNLQCDVDHPTQSMADLLHLKNTFGNLDELKGRRIAMTWAYSPSYGKPLSVPQGIIGVMTRLGMDVVLGDPEGYGLIPEVVELAGRQAAESGGRFQVCHSMDEAFEGADIVYPKSWAPYSVMEERTRLLQAGDRPGLVELEKQALARNASHQNWECTRELMARTRNPETSLTPDGQALYMHCLPADISTVSCKRGEVSADVFERSRIATYLEAGYKPYVIAAMILLTQAEDPVATLEALIQGKAARVKT